MATPLGTYVHDHLAGAQFAVELLKDLQQRADDQRTSALAGEILQDVEADRQVLLEFADAIREPASNVKEAAAWVAQKLSRFKLSADKRLGAFEAVESLCLGILGKSALWQALQQLQLHGKEITALDFSELIARAQEQHSRMESLRLTLAVRALGGAEAT